MFKRVAHVVSFALFAGILAFPLHEAKAVVVGLAVDGIDSDTTVGSTEVRLLLGGNAIRYFIPLSSSPVPCVYGDCGTAADIGFGGQTMEMYLKFEPVSTSNASHLIIHFEDLDLIEANDPDGFLESVEVFNRDGVSITGLIDDIGNGLVTGDAETIQTVAIPLGLLSDETFFARLDFIADSSFKGKNTPEYLIAEIHPVPLPAALPLFGAGLGVLGFIGWRRRKLTVAKAAA